MKLGFNLNLEQKQQLVITPELRQAIQLLQLSSLELYNYIEQEVIENPMLEISSHEEDESKEPGENNQEQDHENEQDRFDIDWQKYFEDSSDLGRQISSNKEPAHQEDDQKSRFESYTAKEPSLMEHLYFQLAVLDVSSHTKELAEFLVGNLDSNGYLQCSLEELSTLLAVPEEQLEEALAVVQSLDPPGVGARSVKECLRLQLESRSDAPLLCFKLVNNYLPEIADNRLDKISRETGEPVDEIQKAVDYIKKLTPKPASTYSQDGLTSYITPDIIIQRVEDDYEVIINDSYTPRLKINSMYRNMLTNNNNSRAAKFLHARLDSALWLIKSIEQRRITLHNIMQALIKVQRPFLDRGVSYLKPLTLKDIAEEIDVHESTVSRATANKYVQTPQGFFPLRFFFSSKVKNASCGQGSSTSIKHKIKELIKNEDQSNPLSDQKIAEILQEESIEISRRTVAKYRQECKIPSSSRRKRYH